MGVTCFKTMVSFNSGTSYLVQDLGYRPLKTIIMKIDIWKVKNNLYAMFSEGKEKSQEDKGDSPWWKAELKTICLMVFPSWDTFKINWSAFTESVLCSTNPGLRENLQKAPRKSLPIDPAPIPPQGTP